MKTSIQKLWSGDLNPWNDHMDRQREARELMLLIERHRHDISEKLNEEEKEILQKYEDAYDELLWIDREDAFVKGFSLGVKLVAEAFVEKGESADG